MKRLILTSSSGSSLMRSDLADAAIMLPFRFVSGPLPSPDELASYVAARSQKHGPGPHWSDFGRWRHGNKARKDLALFEFCKPYETIELRFDPDLLSRLFSVLPGDCGQVEVEPYLLRSHHGGRTKLGACADCSRQTCRPRDRERMLAGLSRDNA